MRRTLALPWATSLTRVLSSDEQKAIDGALSLSEERGIPHDVLPERVGLALEHVAQVGRAYTKERPPLLDGQVQLTGLVCIFKHLDNQWLAVF